MRVCITGANGQVGKALIASADPAHEIVAWDRVALDLTDQDAIRTAIAGAQPDLLINAAAYTAVDKAESESELAQVINGTAPIVMAESLRRCGGRMIHISTDFVFDGDAACAYGPDDQVNPLSAYGASKLKGEVIAAHGHCAILRTAWVYSAGGANFVTTMLRLMRERDELGIVADQIGAPTWASGLAETLWGLADQRVSGTWHHSDAGVASWYDFAVAIAEEAYDLGIIAKMPTIQPITASDYPTPAKRPKFSLLDSRATRELLKDKPVHWRVNLRRMLKEEATLG
ncbi:MAG: dTDP-4-dehydrorhamnose reductase [Pseudomonadota bacterium]